MNYATSFFSQNKLMHANNIHHFRKRVLIKKKKKIKSDIYYFIIENTLIFYASTILHNIYNLSSYCL